MLKNGKKAGHEEVDTACFDDPIAEEEGDADGSAVRMPTRTSRLRAKKGEWIDFEMQLRKVWRLLQSFIITPFRLIPEQAGGSPAGRTNQRQGRRRPAQQDVVVIDLSDEDDADFKQEKKRKTGGHQRGVGELSAG